MRITRNKIKVLRMALGETQEEFSRRFGGRAATVSDWEAGKRKPQPMAAKEIERLYKKIFFEKGA